MKILDLTYLNIPQEPAIVELLKDYGGQISNKTNRYITYMWATSSSIGDDDIRSVSFYIIAPAIDRQHNLIVVDVKDTSTLEVTLWTINSEPIHFDAKIIEQDISDYDNVLFNIFNHPETKKILELFLRQTEMKIKSEE